MHNCFHALSPSQEALIRSRSHCPGNLFSRGNLWPSSTAMAEWGLRQIIEPGHAIELQNEPPAWNHPSEHWTEWSRGGRILFSINNNPSLLTHDFSWMGSTVRGYFLKRAVSLVWLRTEYGRQGRRGRRTPSSPRSRTNT